MKKNILKTVFVVLLIAIIGFYIFDVVVNQIPFTKNLFRTISISAMCLFGFGRLNYSVGRRPLKFYESAHAKVIRTAFNGQVMNRNKLLCALRLFDEGNYRKALKYLRQLQKECQTPDEYYAVWLFIGRSFTEIQMYPEAIQIYRQLINHNLADSRIFSNMGYLYSEMGENDNAISSYNEALFLDKNNAHTYNNMAYLHFNAYEFDKAIPLAEKALELDPKLHPAATLLAIIYDLTDQKDLSSKYRHISIANGCDSESLDAAIKKYRTERE